MPGTAAVMDDCGIIPNYTSDIWYNRLFFMTSVSSSVTIHDLSFAFQFLVYTVSMPHQASSGIYHRVRLLYVTADPVRCLITSYLRYVWSVWSGLLHLYSINGLQKVYMTIVIISLVTTRHLYLRHDFHALVNRYRYDHVVYGMSPLMPPYFHGRHPGSVDDSCTSPSPFESCSSAVFQHCDSVHPNDRKGGGRPALTISREILQQHRSDSEEPEVLIDPSFSYVGHFNVGEASDLCSLHPEYVRCAVPLNVLVSYLTREQIAKIAQTHCVRMVKNIGIAAVRLLFDNHSCAQCVLYTSVFCSSSVKSDKGSTPGLSEEDRRGLVKLQNRLRQQTARKKKIKYEHSASVKRKHTQLKKKAWSA